MFPTVILTERGANPVNTIKRIRTELEDQWYTLCRGNWKCAAQQRFGRLWYTPVLEQIDALDSATGELEELCQESVAMAKSVREPDENDQ